MLPEPLRLLVAAYASGDLSQRRRQAAVRLLKHSAEARALLAELRGISRKLKALPQKALPEDFTDRVIGQLPPPLVTIRPEAVQPRPDVGRRWLTRTLVAAAAVCI